MRIRPLLVGFALAIAPVGPIAAADPQSDARDVLVKYFAAVKAGDWGAMYDLIAEESRAGQSRERFKTAREGGPGAELGKAIQARASYSVGAVRIDDGGTSATGDVSLRVPDLGSPGSGSMPSPEQIAGAPLRDLQRTLQLVVEGGAWKVVRPKARLSAEQMERLQRAARESAERARKEQASEPGKPD